MLKSIRKALFLCVFASFAAGLPGSGEAEEVLIGSWNIRHLGQGDAKNFEAVAHVAGRYDLLAIQEAMTEDGLRRLEAAIEEATAEPWGLLHSRRIGRGSYKEIYGFLWRESRVEYVDGAVVYVDRSDRFSREPFAARFRSADGSSRWVMATVHVLYGDSRADRVPELRALARYWEWLIDTFPEDESFILAGDFNLAPGDPVFSDLKKKGRPLITRGATTLSSIDGRYANLYDNIFLSLDHQLDVQEAGIDRFPARIGWTHEQARRHISDHAPVFLRMAASGPFPARTAPEGAPQPGPSHTPAAGRESEPLLRGNRRSDIYHHPECSGYETTAPHNRVPFDTEEDAREAGYRRARNCDWPAPSSAN